MDDYNIYQDYDNLLFKEEVARGTRLLRAYGHSPSGDSGDVSVRDVKTGLVYISGSPEWVYQRHLGDARAWERTIADLEGNRKVPWSYPTVEMPMHLAIYRARPDVEAIVHTHGEWVSVFAILNWDIPLAWAGEGETGVVRCARHGNAGTEEVGEYTAQALGADFAVIMANHGAVTVGKTIDECFVRAAWLETAARKAYYNILLSGEHKVDHEKIMKGVCR
jgi:ribulose-5-phosphate 4-epimerase/fuculose-1-phosphate aldolase